MAKKKSSAKRRPPASSRRARQTILTSKPSKDPLPPIIYAQASPRSVSGVSMFEGQERITSSTVMNFMSEGDVVQGAVARLQEAGLTILQISPLTINIAGTPAAFRKAFNTDIVVLDKPVIKEFGKKDMGQFLDSPDTAMPGLINTRNTKFEDVLEGVALEEPRYPWRRRCFAPLKAVLAPRRSRRRLAGLQRRPGAPRRDHRARASRSRWSTAGGSSTRSSSTAATGRRRSCSGPRRPIRSTTRAGTEPASRRTSSRSRPTSICCR